MLDLKLPAASSATSTSLRIIAACMLVAALYYASSVVTTLVLSILIAFVLDPGVRALERLRLPRWLSSLILVLLGVALLYFIVYILSSRALSLTADLPRLENRVRQIAAKFEAPFTRLDSTLRQANSSDRSVPTVRIEQPLPVSEFLWRGIGSVYTFAVTVLFIPFLVFFMLTSKDHLWAASLNLFALERRQQAEEIIHGIGQLVRQYVLGNVLVAVISALLTTPAFVIIGLPHALILGPLSAILNLIPYIGVVLAMIPPLITGLIAFESIGPFAAIAATVAVVHLLAANFLTPRFVGRRVNLSALSVTLALMFWGSLWGGIGLVLAIPITAAFKAVCDNIRSLRALGAWLGEG
jgi:predicted PurR-regulated permease PerM